MRWTCHPADVVVGIEEDALFALLLVQLLETVLVHEYRGGAALPGICLYCFLEQVNRRSAAMVQIQIQS